MAGGIALAEEKSWGPCTANLIVIGKLEPMYVFPWFGGWHIWGTIQVNEVIKGAADGNRLSYRFHTAALNWQEPTLLECRGMRGYGFSCLLMTVLGRAFMGRGMEELGIDPSVMLRRPGSN